jgi:Mce-associated membrane protein
VTGPTTRVLGSVALVLAAVVAAEAWYLWGASTPEPSAARPVTSGDLVASTAVAAAAQDTARIFTTSWQHYDAHAAAVAPLMTAAMAGRYRASATPVRARVLAAHTTTTTRVAGSGVVRATPDQVLALVFLDQRVKSAGSPATYTARRALVTMVRGDRGWVVDNVQTR